MQGAQNRRIFRPRCALTDATKAAMAGRNVGAQDVLRTRALAQVDMTDDPGAGPHRTIEAAGAHRRDAIDELGFTDAAQRLRTIGTIHCTAFHIDRGDDVVPAS